MNFDLVQSIIGSSTLRDYQRKSGFEIQEGKSWLEMFTGFKMEQPQVFLEAFGLDYVLPISAALRSKVLANIFSGQYLELNRVELNFDPLLQSSWEVVYRQLLVPKSEGSWGSLQLLSPDVLWDIFQIGEYLQIPDLLDDFRKLIVNGNIPPADLIQFYERYRQDPAIVHAAALTIIRDETQFERLPVWVQEIFPIYETKELPQDGFILSRFRPPDNQNLYFDQNILKERYGGVYNRICQSFRQPKVLTVDGLVKLSPDRNVHKVNDMYLTCPDDNYPNFSMIRGVMPCCVSSVARRLNFNETSIPWDKLGDRVAMMSQSGFLIFLPAGFQGDYICTNNYELITDINAVVV